MDIREQIYNVFNSDGKLVQVEYALEAVANCTQILTLKSREGIIAISKKINKPIHCVENYTTIHKIADNIYMNITGLPADVCYIIRKARDLAATLEYNFGCTVSPAIFCKELASKFQTMIQRSSRRIIAFSAAVFGMDGDQPLLSFTDVSAVDPPCNAMCAGTDHSKMMKYLEKYYQVGGLEEGLEIGTAALLESIGRDAESIEIEMAIVDKNGFRLLADSEIERVLQKVAETPGY
ncbi:hypothetical protein ENBRE01_0853 [Enteropsectra breve]|nr:hypothetical protein ENBRE01_0853 [Enteropsectra breve]